MEAFERAVSEAASLAWHLCEKGYSVKLVTRDKVIGYGEGVEQKHKILIALALIEPTNDRETFFFNDKPGFGVETEVIVACGAFPNTSTPVNSNFELIPNERNSVENQ
jgi:uncharacterized protein (DUF58 family)